MATDLARLGYREYGPPVVFFALEREAAPFRRLVKRERLAVEVHVSGVGRAAATGATRRILAGRQLCPRLVVAAGFCGALAPDLQVGDVVAASVVLDWSGTTLAIGSPVEGIRTGRFLCVDRLICDPAEKRLLHTDYAADIVDMESGGVGEACGERLRVPFLAVRAVSDTADTALSPELVRLLSGGSVSPLKAAAALVRKPALLGEFRRLARDTKIAAQRLAEALARMVSRDPEGSAEPPRSPPGRG